MLPHGPALAALPIATDALTLASVPRAFAKRHYHVSFLRSLAIQRQAQNSPR